MISSSLGGRASVGPLHIRFQIFNTKGPVGGERITEPTTSAADMAALDNGQFVIAHLNDFGEDATADTLSSSKRTCSVLTALLASPLCLDQRATHPRDLADACAAIRSPLSHQLGPAQRR